mgnify:CR=1 FL=1
MHNYFNIYMLLLTLSVLLLSLDGFDLVTTFTSVVTCLNNVGPGLEMVGPMGSFADFSAPAKLLLAFDMLAGRLELYPMLALFARASGASASMRCMRQERNKYESFISFLARKGTEKNSKQIKKNAGDCR